MIQSTLRRSTLRKATTSLAPVASLAALCLTAPLAAQDAAAIEAYFESTILPITQEAAIISAITTQNMRTARLSADEVRDLDLAWQAEFGAADRPLIDSVVETPVSAHLREIVDASKGEIAEVFVMDSSGLNVASAGVTSDYWQGDEAKFQDSYGAGPTGLHVGEVEFDDSSQTYLVQISHTINDPVDGSPIGAITVGVNAEALY